MALLIVGLIVFLGVHSLRLLAPSWRERQLALRGKAVWQGAYSVVSLLGFVLIVVGYGQARAAPVLWYAPWPGMRHLTFLLMLPVFALLLAAYLPGRLQRLTRHPMLLGTMLWSVAHLLINGWAQDVVLFGAIGLWALAVRWDAGRRTTPSTTPGAPAGPYNDALAVLGGLALYVLFLLWAHRVLMGVSPLGG